MKLKEFYGEYINYVICRGSKPKTIAKHRSHIYGSLSHSVQDIELKDLTYHHIFLVKKAGALHGERYGQMEAVMIFRALIQYLEDTGQHPPISWRRIELPRVSKKKVQYLTKKEFESLRSAIITKTEAGLRFRTLVEVLISTGMRISEARSVKVEDIDFDTKQIDIVNCKNGDEEIVYLNDISIEWIKKYLEEKMVKSEFLFSGTNRKTQVGNSTFRTYLKEILTTLPDKIQKKMNFHIIRKSFVTWFLQDGVDVQTVQYLARHKSPETTLKFYAAVDFQKLRIYHDRVLGKIDANLVAVAA